MHGASAADKAKEALIIGVAVDIEAADFEVLAVKGVGVWVAAGADWGPGVRFSTDAGEVDVVHQLGMGVGVCCLIDFAVDEIAEVFKVDGAVDLVWVFLRASAGEGVIFGIGLEDGVFFFGADAPGVVEIPAFEFVLIGEIADGGCACVRVIITDARLSGVHRLCLQKIALVDGGAVIPYNAADGAINKTAEITGVVAICDAAVARIAPNDAAKVAKSGGIITSDVAGAVAVCDAAVVKIAPDDTAEIAAKRSDRKVIEKFSGVVAVCDGAATTVLVTVLPHNAAKIADAGVRARSRTH